MKNKSSLYMNLIGALILFSGFLTACATLPSAVATPTVEVSTPPVEPTVLPTETATSTHPVAQLAIEALATQTGISADVITVQAFEAVDWPNGCLGIELTDTACTDAIVPGYLIILQADGKTYEYHSNLDGSLLLPATSSATPPPSSGNSKIGELASAALAQQLGIAVETITVMSVEAVDWPDGCLGINTTDQACITVITPGYRIILEANGQTYEYHSNQDGSQMLLASNVPVIGEIPALQVDVQGGIAGFCDHVNLFTSGLATYQSCKVSQETRYQLTPAQLQTLEMFVNNYSSFEHTLSDPAVADQMTVQIIFNGKGTNAPTAELYQQMQTLGLEVISGAMGAPTNDIITAPFQSLAGLIYTTVGGLWQISPDGTPQQLSKSQETRLSPDGTQLLAWDGNDLFLTTLATGETRNLTNTPDRIEYLPQSSGYFADKIFFTSFPISTEGEAGFTGYLTVINPDGSGYTVLDEENNAGVYAVSPDEHTVAYGGGATTWLYHLDTGTREVFNPSDYALPDVTSLSSPSWSPNGQMLAWIASGNFGGQDQFALAVFDLNEKVGAIFHPHHLSGLGGFPPSGVWSPDGSHIALNTFDMNTGEAGVWVVPVVPLFNKRPEIYVGGTNPMWSPDGLHLTILNAQGNLVLVTTESWHQSPVELSEKAVVVLDWK